MSATTAAAFSAKLRSREDVGAVFSEDFHRSVAESLGGSLESFTRTGEGDGEVTLTIVRQGPTCRSP